MSNITTSGYTAALDNIIQQRLLYPVFQPIIDQAQKRIIGYEALIRGPIDSSLHSPLHLFNQAEKDNRLLEVDFMGRCRIVEQFFAQKLPGKLFLNVMPQAMVCEHYSPMASLASARARGLTIDPSRIVIEITEHHPIEQFAPLIEAVKVCRELGFQVALDDLGGGHNGLRSWSELSPDYVKIDKHFIQDIHLSPKKRHFVHHMVDMAQSLNTLLIAEGIETQEEFQCLQSMQVNLFQGYYFARPKEKPTQQLPSDCFTDTACRYSNNESVYTRSLCEENPAIYQHNTISSAAEQFLAHQELQLLPVLNESGRPVGILWRDNILETFAKHYGRELYGKRSVEEMMDRAPIIIDGGTHIERASRIVTESQDAYSAQAFIVTEKGLYSGIASFMALLRSITDLQVKNARYANPLTLLPGNVPINETLESLLNHQLDFSLCYLDIDNFKAYNDAYGYKQGDEIILHVANILKKHAHHALDFIGHIGGDDFIIIFRSTDWQQRCHRILADMEKLAPTLYSHKDRQQQGIYAQDRQGVQQFFPYVSLSIGAVLNQQHPFSCANEMAEKASEVKKKAKTITGNSLYIDQRQHRVIAQQLAS